MTVANKPGHRGELGVSRKTIARGMPGVSGVTVVTNACAFYHCARGCGRAERPAFPAPSVFRRRDVEAKLGRIASRKCEVAFTAVIVRAGGRSNISATSMIESRSRGVLDTPHARGMTVECAA